MTPEEEKEKAVLIARFAPYAEIELDDLKVVIDGALTSMSEAVSFAFDCADVQNWEDFDETYHAVCEDFDKAAGLLILLKSRIQAEPGDGAD